MFLVSGKRKFLLDFDSVFESDGAKSDWLNLRLILIDGDKKFEAVSPALQLEEFAELSKWFVSVIERPFKDIAKTKFKRPELCFEFSPEKFDIERGSFLRVTFAGEFLPDFVEGNDSYVFEGYFPRPQLANFLRHLKIENHPARSACEGQPYPPDSPGRKFREFLFYNYENAEYEYLQDNFFLDEVEKNILSIEKSYELIGDGGINFISVMASQRTNLFEDALTKLLKVAAIPYPAWYMIYDILGKAALYYKLYAPALEILTQGIKTARKAGDEAHLSAYKKMFDEALAGFVELCKKSFKSAAIDSPEQRAFTSMLPLAFYLYSEHGYTAFDKMGTFQLIRESISHRPASSKDKYEVTVGCCILCAILIQFIVGNPLFNDCLEIVQKQMRKFIRAYQQIFPQDSSGYSAAFEKFNAIFSKDFANTGKNSQPEVFDLASFIDSDGGDFFGTSDSAGGAGLAGATDSEVGTDSSGALDFAGGTDSAGDTDSTGGDFVAKVTSSDSKIVSALEIAIWCNLNFQDFDKCVSKANRMVQKDESADEDAVAVTRIIAFFENAGEKESGCTAEAVSAEAGATESGATESGKKSYSESMARIVESNLRRMIEV
jgi:hypothetical protein